VGVGVGVLVGVEVGTGVRVVVAVGDGAAITVTVAVTVALAVTVWVTVAVAVTVFVTVLPGGFAVAQAVANCCPVPVLVSAGFDVQDVRLVAACTAPAARQEAAAVSTTATTRARLGLMGDPFRVG
jgi:hypothetical protein